MKIGISAGVFAALLSAACPLFAARTILYYEDECCRYITEGEFAVLYAQGLQLREPAQGWTVQTAAAALTTLGHQPDRGWVLSRFLSEAVASRLLQGSPFYRKPFNSEAFQRSSVLVTIARARSVFPSDEGISQGEFAVLLARALALPLPPGGWTAATAVEALQAQPSPIRPAKGWQAGAVLREAEMIQILGPTRYRTVSIDPAMEIPPLQAYSLLFGRFEVATEGHFALFLVNALGVTPPAGGWTKAKALDFLVKQFGIENGYGWNANSPLCAGTFDHAMRAILTKLQSAPSPPSRARLEMPAEYPGRGPSPDSGLQSELPDNGRETEAFLRDMRRNGLIPSDRCAIIPAQGLVQLGPGEGLPDHPMPPASRSIPPE